MKIAEVQIWFLINVLRDTLGIEGGVFTLDRDQRLKLYNQIINQQSHKLEEIGDAGIQDSGDDSTGADQGSV